MKKNCFCCLELAMLCGLVSSCSDEDFYFETSDELTSTGIRMDAKGGTFEIPVKSSGAYTIVDGGDNRWLQTIVSEGSVKGHIWPNYGEEPRKSQIVLENNGHKLTIPVAQEFFDDGMNGTTYHFIGVAGSKGVGCGLDIETLEPKETPIVDMYTLGSLIDSNKIAYGRFYRQSINKEHIYHDVNTDSTEVKNDTLGIDATVDISYGLFHLNVKGAYHSSESKTDTAKIIRTAGNYPVLTTSVDVKSLIKMASKYAANPDDIIKSYKLGDEASYLLWVINESFGEDINETKNLISKGDSAYKDKVENLVDDYGAAITTGATLGGKINLQCICGTTSMADTMKINGSVDVSVKTGLFSLDAGVKAGYSKIATTLLKGSKVTATILGGSSDKSSKLFDAFVSDDAKDSLSISKARLEWMNSVVSDDNDETNTAEVLGFRYLPIWAFFDEKSRDKVRAVVLEMYKNSPALPLLRDNKSFVSND